MKKEKQIEVERNEIAVIISQNFRFNEEQYDPSDFEWSAHCIQMAGYRKASEVAEEIFAEIEEILIDNSYQIPEELYDFYDKRGVQKALAELKKKYESEDTE